MKVYERLFTLLNYSWYILFILAYFNISQAAVLYLATITFYFKIFVASVLFYFFNPWKKPDYTETHRKIVFTAASFILISEGLMSVFNRIHGDVVKVTSEVHTHVSKIVS